MLRALYLVVIALCSLPLLPGVVGVFVSAFSYVPPIGLENVSVDAFTQVLQWPGVEYSIGLTVATSLLSSYLACLMTFIILQSTWSSAFWRKVEWLLSPLLAMPHVAFAIGFAFLFAPTGMGARVLFHWFGYQADPQAVGDMAWLVKDPYSLGLTLMLALKEVPFLLMMSIPVLQHLNVSQSEKVSASLGYNRWQTWWKCLFPQWLNKMRFPMLAVVAYSVSVVDVALIIGPTNPPTFAVLVWQWFNEPDLTLLPRAAAGAVILFVIASVLIGFVRGVEFFLLERFRSWQSSGRKGYALPGKGVFISLAMLTMIMIPLTLIWSIAQRWRFPDLLPSQYSLRFWQYEWQGISSAIGTSMLLGIVSATAALCLAIIAHEYRLKYRWQLPGYVIAIPMLIPQLSILFGMQIVTLYIQADAYYLWVVWAHVFFAFPFVYLSLDGPWRAFNSRLMTVAASLGKAPIHAWFKVKLPLLFPAIVFAWAIGVSVSLAQYLPTLMLGAGRIATVTTEAVALSSGFDRRVTAIYAIWQALLPLLFFFLAVLLSRIHRSSRRFSIKGIFSHGTVSQKHRHP